MKTWRERCVTGLTRGDYDLMRDVNTCMIGEAAQAVGWDYGTRLLMADRLLRDAELRALDAVRNLDNRAAEDALTAIEDRISQLKREQA